MNCDQFQSRMDSLLDSRQDFMQDDLLRRHTESCPSCQERLLVWSKINDVISVEVAANMRSDRSQPPRGMPVLKTPQLTRMVAIAAAVVLVVSLGPWKLLRTNPKTQQAALRPHPNADSGLTLAPVNEEITGAAAPQARLIWQSDDWWTTMSDEQWVHDTMPGVISVGQGVAPIGRSMKQAFAILMIQTRPPNIDPTPVSPNAEPKPFSEQTSNGIPIPPLATWA